jgi:hypothetical protein
MPRRRPCSSYTSAQTASAAQARPDPQQVAVMIVRFLLGSTVSRISNIHTSQFSTRQGLPCACSGIPVALAVETSNHRTVNRVAARPPESLRRRLPPDPSLAPSPTLWPGESIPKVGERRVPVNRTGRLGAGPGCERRSGQIAAAKTGVARGNSAAATASVAPPPSE